MFDELVIMYLFLGGCGAGILLVSSLWSYVFHIQKNRTRRESDAFGVVRNRCFVVGTVVTVVGAVCLLSDLGRPERFLLLFFRPNRTYLTFGAFALTLLIALGFFLSAANCLYVPRMKTKMKAVAEIACVVFAVAVMTYTGLFLQNLKAVAFWDTWLLPVLFVLSAVSMGFSSCALASSLLRDSWLIDESIDSIHKIHLAVMLAEFVALVAFIAAAAMGRGESSASLSLILTEPLIWWLALGVVLCGLVVPAIGDILYIRGKASLGFPLTDALCLFGGFALRLCVVSAGLH